MKTTLYTLLFAMLASLWLSNCKDKSNNPEPQPRGNYWSKMTCKVDGKDWGDCSPSPIGGKMQYVTAEWFKNYVGKPLTIDFTNTCDSFRSYYFVQDIYIVINPFNGPGSYKLSGNDSYGQCFNMMSSYKMRTNHLDTGIINIIRFDTLSKKVSGTFSFTAYNVDSQRTVHVTEGKFDNVDFITN